MRAPHPALALLVALVWGTGARAAETRPPPGASACTGCHAEGSAMGVLAGRSADEIAGALDAFRSGARPATLMNRIAKGFDAQESRAIAAWFAAQAPR
ncbi:c-type cytochrome [Methylobacterium radiodurans]|uniref:Cytochrome C n=1 Tax=Methylobacterium radiodurans TaxID=2202828 RepID=A0A2U8VYM0_9HYPH|nr:cytochrome C [Methylobacterium radiodurans]AWN38461.1 cytochrome C [Methylobacterium radiodurans]